MAHRFLLLVLIQPMQTKVIQANEIQKLMKQTVTKYNTEQTVQYF